MEKPETKEGQAIAKMQEARSGLSYGLSRPDRLKDYAEQAIIDLTRAISLLVDAVLERRTHG